MSKGFVVALRTGKGFHAQMLLDSRHRVTWSIWSLAFHSIWHIERTWDDKLQGVERHNQGKSSMQVWHSKISRRWRTIIVPCRHRLCSRNNEIWWSPQYEKNGEAYESAVRLESVRSSQTLGVVLEHDYATITGSHQFYSYEPVIKYTGVDCIACMLIRLPIRYLYVWSRVRMNKIRKNLEWSCNGVLFYMFYWTP